MPSQKVSNQKKPLRGYLDTMHVTAGAMSEVLHGLPHNERGDAYVELSDDRKSFIYGNERGFTAIYETKDGRTFEIQFHERTDPDKK